MDRSILRGCANVKEYPSKKEQREISLERVQQKKGNVKRGYKQNIKNIMKV